MEYNILKAIQVLERTPKVLNTLLSDIDNEWILENEGGETWSAYDVVGHLIHGERKDWMERIHIILDTNGDRRFHPFDRFAQFNESKGKTLTQLLDEFAALRSTNLNELKALKLTETHLDMTGIHPTFGEVTLRNLLATWPAHDLAYLNQITRAMAKQYKEAIGPWVNYMSVMK